MISLNQRNLRLRIASTIVLVPIAIVAIYAGGWLFDALCAIAAGAILWEWAVLMSGRANPRIIMPGLAGLLAAVTFVQMNDPGAAFGSIAIGAVVAGSMAGLPRPGDSTLGAAAWGTAGVLYAGSAFLGPALLRRGADFGFAAVLFVAITVWATDIVAYFVGSSVGGPLLWPSISPKKTWSGAIGGLAGGVAAGTLVFYASGIGKPAVAGGIALVLSVLAQTGDLFESGVKRHFGAKDSGRLIPGHGGVMDRLDGLLFAAIAALLIGILRHGTDAPARGLLVW